jgi:hypothetical protein
LHKSTGEFNKRFIIFSEKIYGCIDKILLIYGENEGILHIQGHRLFIFAVVFSCGNNRAIQEVALWKWLFSGKSLFFAVWER